MPSPFTEEIYRDWEKLIRRDDRTQEDGRTPHPDQIAGFNALYAKATKDGQWTVSPADAGLVAMLGVTITLQQKQYPEAAALARQYLDHPRVDGSDLPSWEHFSTRLGIALILIGEIDEGIAQLRTVLVGEDSLLQHRRHVVRNDLRMALEDLPQDDRPDSRLARFTSDLLQNWIGQEAKTVKALQAKSYRELAAILESTYPPK